jgi:hypothetical protein
MTALQKANSSADKMFQDMLSVRMVSGQWL